MISRWGYRSRVETDVLCPECQEGTLGLRFGCLNTALVCGRCQRAYQLSELVHRVDEVQFERLAQRVGDRLSDRVS